MLDKKHFRKTVLSFLIPMALQNLIILAISSTDVIMLGKFSEIALSASSLASQIQFVLILIFFGIASGSTVLTAQYWGKKMLYPLRKLWQLELKQLLFLVVFSLCLLFSSHTMP